jgi:hypothetical protein
LRPAAATCYKPSLMSRTPTYLDAHPGARRRAYRYYWRFT